MNIKDKFYVKILVIYYLSNSDKYLCRSIKIIAKDNAEFIVIIECSKLTK